MSEMIVKTMVASDDQLIALLGTPAPQITSKYAFPTNTSPRLPEPGKVTLLMKIQKGEDALMTPDLAILHRLYNKYHAQGLEIVLVLATHGSSWYSPPQNAADEAKTIAWYYLDHLGLPFTIVVYESPVTKRPNGWLVRGETVFDRMYNLGGPWLIDRNGRFNNFGMGLDSEAAMSAFIERALAVPGVQANK
jgi:hypothetical protein